MAEVVVHPDPDALAADVAARFVELLADLQAGGAVPHVALTGGSIAERVHRAIARVGPGSGVDWGAVEFWWGDERYVAADSPDRNARQAREAFLDKVGAHRVHEMPASDSGLSLDEAAAAYGEEVRRDGSGAFDVLMLGLGPDGHVASLFPGNAALDVEDAIAVGVPDSPKPPPERISLTFPALNRSRAVWFLVSSAEKADAVARARADEGSVAQTPARGITGEPGATVTWFLDRAAAGEA